MSKTKQTETGLIWSAVNDAAVLDGKDLDEARQLADDVVRRYQHTYEIERNVEIRRKMYSFAKVLWSFVGIVVLVGALAVGGYSLWWMEDNDYAGMDQKYVYDEAAEVLDAYYGLNDRPGDLRATGREQGRFFGRAVWKVRYVGSEGDVCVFVWGNSPVIQEGEDDHFVVTEGADCT